MDTKAVHFLWSAAGSVPRHASNALILSSHYLTKFKQLTQRSGVSIHCKLFGGTPMCQHCCSLWTDGNYCMRILPNKINKQRIKKVLEKSKSSPESLIPFERKLLHSYVKKNGNKMELTCYVCSKKTLVLMKKPEREVKKKSPYNEEIVKKKKVKKKSKDRFAGLKHSAVIAAMPITKTKQKSVVTNNKTKLMKTAPLSQNIHKPSHAEVLSKAFRKKDTLQKILGSSQNSNKNSASKLQNFLASLK